MDTPARPSLADRARAAGLRPGTVAARISRGWGVERALVTPARPCRPAPGEAATARQAAVLEFIRAECRARGRPPTFREIGRHFGITCNGVACHVRALIGRGLLRREPRLARSLFPIDIPEPEVSRS